MSEEVTGSARKAWMDDLRRDERGFYSLRTDATRGIEVRFFLSDALLADIDEQVYQQVLNATAFPGVKLVVITPDVHSGYGVPVGCVILTDAKEGAVAMGPVGYDIGCGMISARSNVAVSEATPERRLQFNRAVIERIEMGAGGKSRILAGLSENEFERLVRGGAERYMADHRSNVDRSRTERDRLPVDDDWQIPWGGRGRPERGVKQLGSLGGGNHFIELQRCVQTDTLFVQVHTGSRGFGHGLATNYFDLARAEKPDKITQLDLGHFTPDSRHHGEYLNAVSAGGNFAIINRLIIYEQLSTAFEETFGEPLELIYEISHNLVQLEEHPEFGQVWVHRKGATRAFPAGHPALKGTMWEQTGHPVLIPGSNFDSSFILRPLPAAKNSGFSVNHGAGRRLSRSRAIQSLNRREIEDRYREAGILVNADNRVPIDESGPCYKPAREVVDCVVSAGLAEIEYELEPLASLKGTEEPRGSRSRKRR
ncbi:MAG TPA: RtcB family protein [Candidatus Eremiobacteraceae bacterium]|nr:RtcB family protein [Candidatus Eremiobacteraceae bacterium]